MFFDILYEVEQISYMDTDCRHISHVYETTGNPKKKNSTPLGVTTHSLHLQQEGFIADSFICYYGKNIDWNKQYDQSVMCLSWGLRSVVHLALPKCL